MDPSLSAEEQFAAILQGLGITVPTGYHEATVIGYRELRRMAELLRGPREAVSEPSQTFDPRGARRGE